MALKATKGWLLLWAGALALLASPESRAADRLEGEVGLRWEFLTRRNSVSPDYQELGATLRLATPPWRQVRLKVEASARQGLDERFAGTANPYQDRQQVRLALLEGQGVAGGQFLLGRHCPSWRGLSAWDIDGLSWQRRGRAWTLGLSGGYQVPYWEPNPGLGSALQWGGMLHWHSAARWNAAAALLHEADSQGRARWRAGLEGEWKPRAQLSENVRFEIDPTGGRQLYWRLESVYRSREPLELRLSYTDRILAAFPVRSAGDSLIYHGRARDLGLSVRYRWGKSLSLHLQWRATYGERQLRSTQFQARWSPFFRRGAAFILRAGDHWSPWRRLEQVAVDWSSPWGRRLELRAGFTGSYFKWNTSRAPTWELRVRPQLGLSCRAGGGIWLETRVEQTLDEFSHLRTLATAGLRYNL